MKTKIKKSVDGLCTAYNFDYTKAVRGKYNKRILEKGANAVMLEADASKTFSDSAAVNAALNDSIKRGVQDAKNKKGRFVA
ncbi:MAG: hypothetical protein ABFD76_04060 [Smithella sp.]|jgi:hypothetical protein